MPNVRPPNSPLCRQIPVSPTGFIDELTRFLVTGWAADLDELDATLRFGVFVNGEGCAVVMADGFRPGLEQLAPGASGRYVFRCYFPAPLSPYRDHQVTLRCSNADLTLRADLPALAPIAIPPADDAWRPHGPILLTSGGRCGSTAIMEVLRRHPRIVVAGQPPYETEMGCYYAYALRALTAAANHERSLRPERVTDVQQQYQLGFNPFMQSFAFGSMPELRQFLSRNVAGRVGDAFRGIILDYYQVIARAQGRKHPVFFAEKTLPEPDSRLGVRYMFGNTKEIVLVRDPRDVICSFMKHGGIPFQEALGDAVTTTRRCLEIKAEADDSVYLLQYEDFVAQPRETAEALFRFVGLAPAAYDDDGMGQLFSNHGTSRTPADSIGRWRRDLSAEQLGECHKFDHFLAEFGYSPGTLSCLAPGGL